MPPHVTRGVWNDEPEDAELVIVSVRIDDPSGDGETVGLLARIGRQLGLASAEPALRTIPAQVGDMGFHQDLREVRIRMPHVIPFPLGSGRLATLLLRARLSGLRYLDDERLALKDLDVKRNTATIPREEEDHIDRFLRRLDVLPPDSGIDLEVEALVGRINGISRRIKRGMEGTLAEFDLT